MQKKTNALRIAQSHLHTGYPGQYCFNSSQDSYHIPVEVNLSHFINFCQRI